jgi:hypothetical protein
MAGAGAIRAGKAVVEISLQDNVRAGLAKAAGQIQAFASQVTAAGLSLSASGTAILGASAFAAKSFADAGSEINDFSERTGVAAESASGLKFALEQSGSSLGDLEVGLRKMQKTLVEAQQGSEGAASAFGNLGLTAGELAGLRPEEQLAKIADGIARVEDPAARAAYAMGIFGKSGTNLIPALAGGSKGIDEMQARAEKLGLVFTGDTAKAADTLGDAIDEVKGATMGAVNALGGALAPIATEVARAISGAVAGFSKFVKQNPEVVNSIAKVAAGVALAGAGLVAFGVAIKGVFAAGALLSALANPVGILIAAVGGLGVAALAVGNSFSNAKQSAESSLSAISGEVNATIGDIVASLQAGDLSGAAELALSAVRFVFEAAIAKITVAWDNFTSSIAQALIVVFNKVKSLFDGVTTSIAQTITQISNKLGVTKLVLGVELSEEEAQASIQNLENQNANYNKQLEQNTLDRIALIEKESQAEQDRIDAQLKAAKEKLKTARQEVAARRDAELLANAQYGPDASLATQIQDQIDIAIPAIDSLVKTTDRAISARGTFFGPDVASLQGGSISVQQKIASATEQTAKNTQRILESMGDGDTLGT